MATIILKLFYQHACEIFQPFYSILPLIAVLSEPIFRWEVTFVFSKLTHIAWLRGVWFGLKSCLIAVLTVFLWTFNSLACFLINFVWSILITVARAVKKLIYFLVFCLILPSSFSIKSSFRVFFLCSVYGQQRKFGLVSALSKS